MSTPLHRCWLSQPLQSPQIRSTRTNRTRNYAKASNWDVEAHHSTPLLDAVLQRGNRVKDSPFHVPGHKRGRALDPGMQQLLGMEANDSCSSPSLHNPLRFDLTELAGLDYLSSPTGVIAQAQQAAAQAFGADQTWFLVNGCSVGIHAAVMATVNPGQTILLARNCHLSAFSACVITGCKPLWLKPEEDTVHGIAHCVTPEELTAGFTAAKQHGLYVGAVMVVSPTYYGAVARIEELAAICHVEGVPLLVDEAHGGHLDFVKAQQEQLQQHTGKDNSTTSSEQPRAEGGPSAAGSTSTSRDKIPCSALSAGADVVMHSSHKVLTAMTQSAMLHVKGTRVQPDRISKALQVLQTSSPSYLLLSSLDAARRHATVPSNWSTPLSVAAASRQGLLQLSSHTGNQLLLLQQGCCGSEDSICGFDPLRLVVNVQGLGLSGYAAAEWLENHHDIVPELATAQLVVFIIGPGSIMQDAAALVAAFKDLCSVAMADSSKCVQDSIPSSNSPLDAQPQGPANSSPSDNSWIHQNTCGPVTQQLNMTSTQQFQAMLSPREAFFANTECIKLADAAGRVSAELLCPYPPGVPVLFPGEVITAGVIRQLQSTLANGGVVTGAHDSSLTSVLVVADGAGV